MNLEIKKFWEDSGWTFMPSILAKVGQTNWWAIKKYNEHLNHSLLAVIHMDGKRSNEYYYPAHAWQQELPAFDEAQMLRIIKLKAFL